MPVVSLDWSGRRRGRGSWGRRVPHCVRGWDSRIAGSPSSWRRRGGCGVGSGDGATALYDGPPSTPVCPCLGWSASPETPGTLRGDDLMITPPQRRLYLAAITAYARWCVQTGRPYRHPDATAS